MGMVITFSQLAGSEREHATGSLVVGTRNRRQGLRWHTRHFPVRGGPIQSATDQRHAPRLGAGEELARGKRETPGPASVGRIRVTKASVSNGSGPVALIGLTVGKLFVVPCVVAVVPTT